MHYILNVIFPESNKSNMKVVALSVKDLSCVSHNNLNPCVFAKKMWPNQVDGDIEQMLFRTFGGPEKGH